MEDEYITLHGTWWNNTKFTTDDGRQLFILAYQYDIDRIKDLFPFDCYVQLKGNSVKNYVIG